MSGEGFGPHVSVVIAGYAPRSVSGEAAAFARAVVAQARPGTAARAKALLFAVSKLAAFAERVGLELSSDVVLSEAVIERFIVVGCPGVSPATRRTLRTNLRALARAIERYPQPAPVALARERAKRPYSPAEIDAYLRLADAQSTRARRLRANALVCLGTGAGVIASELRHVRGSDVVARAGGVIVEISGARARSVPVLSRYHERLLRSAAFAGDRFIIGGRDPDRRNVTDTLCAALSTDSSLPRLQAGRLRSSWLVECSAQIGLGAFMQAAGITCSQRLGDLAAQLPEASEHELVALLGEAEHVSAELERIEQIIDAAGIAAEIELMLPIGVRPRQLKIRTLLIGMTLALHAGRQAFLTDVHATLTALPTEDQRRLAVIAPWPDGEHQLTYRQVEYTFDRLTRALAKHTPDGTPSKQLQAVLDRLLEASVQVLGEPTSKSYAVDWTDQQTWSLPPPKKPAGTSTSPPNTSTSAVGNSASDDHDGDDAANDTTHQPPPPPCADPEASWGHRRGDAPGHDDELFYGYYLQAATIVNDEHDPPVAELARRMHLSSCDHDPPPAFVPVLKRMHTDGIPISDVLVDSGYSYRRPEHWALPLRTLGIQLICDLHPNDRGPHGTHHGAIITNGQLYCPATPTTLLALGPLHRAATSEQTATHDQQTAELHRYKLSPISRPDPDGYHRVICPAAHGKLRCPHRPQSLTLPNDRATIHNPPQHPPVCCTQQTITVPPSINAKTAQKHNYPSPQHRASYNRRTAAERTFSTIKDPATTDITRGWCRLMGLTPIALFTATALIARNIRVADAFTARQAENQRREAHGLPPKRRKRRRQTIHDLATTAHAP